MTSLSGGRHVTDLRPRLREVRKLIAICHGLVGPCAKRRLESYRHEERVLLSKLEESGR
jgi:hypothetical protein